MCVCSPSYLAPKTPGPLEQTLINKEKKRRRRRREGKKSHLEVIKEAKSREANSGYSWNNIADNENESNTTTVKSRCVTLFSIA